MPAISGPNDGPVAVTGASGYIGSQLVKNLVNNGYTVRACVRDATRDDKVSYLKASGNEGPGSLELFSRDLFKSNEGVYDDVFQGCSAVFHVAADIGSNPDVGKPTPQRSFDGGMTTAKGVFDSCEKAGSVQRVVYTSSMAAVVGLGPGGKSGTQGYVSKDDDWAGDGPYETIAERWTVTSPKSGKTHKLWSLDKQGYAMGKVEAEHYAYEWGDRTGIDVVSCNPASVLGPLMGAVHNATWQKRIGQMLMGETGHEDNANSLWNIVDTRDIAESQRLMATKDVAKNGSRYMLVANEEEGWPTVQQLIDLLQELYPDVDIAGGHQAPPTPNVMRAKCTKAMEELGLKPHSVRDTLKATVDTLIDVAGIVPKKK